MRTRTLLGLGQHRMSQVGQQSRGHTAARPHPMALAFTFGFAWQDAGLLPITLSFPQRQGRAQVRRARRRSPVGVLWAHHELGFARRASAPPPSGPWGAARFS